MKIWEEERNDVSVLDAPALLSDKLPQKRLLVFNDDHNTFEHVIETLMQVCEHTEEQAEQCTLIIHYKGKCTVKEGTAALLKAMCTAICDRGIKASVV
jgi:ATP-dependent Clp protease adaptor protein ClpS